MRKREKGSSITGEKIIECTADAIDVSVRSERNIYNEYISQEGMTPVKQTSRVCVLSWQRSNATYCS